MLSEEQIKQIREQLIEEINLKFPEEKKSSAIKQLQTMNAEQLEQFLIQNNLIKSKSPGQGIETPQCIFCSIIEGNINSYKIDENKQAIAILEINPISKAHVLILPKEHISDLKKIPREAFTLAKKILKKITTKLKPKDVEISPSCIMEHCILNVLPIYTNENLNSKKYQATQEELLEVQKILKIKKKIPKIKKLKTEKIEAEKLWLPRRIP